MRTTTFTRWRARITTVALAVTTSTTLAVVAPVASAGTVGDPAPIENRAAAAAITALTTDDAGRAVTAIPADFDSVMGYRPTLAAAMVVDRRMHSACETRIGETSRAGCFAMADIAASAVNANSWRQGYVSPRPELPAKLISQGALAATTAAG